MGLRFQKRNGANRGGVLLAFFFTLLFWETPVLPGDLKSPVEFKQALPGWTFVFPRDHRVHRDFKTEWWYYNGHLRDGQGHSYGYQLTFFRVGLLPGAKLSKGSRWRVREVFMAHLAVTDVADKRFLFQEKVDRGNLGLAGADDDRYHVWVGPWQVTGVGKTHQLTAGDSDLAIHFTVTPTRAPIIHGHDGISQKGSAPGQASHYYSLTRLDTRGELFYKGKKIPVTGTSWMDHEFGSNQLQADQVGWDWFSLQLNDGTDLMIYQLRLKDGGVDPHSSGTLVRSPSGATHLPLSTFKVRILGFWKSPRSGAQYPGKWEIEIPQEEIKLELIPWLPDQELMTPRSTRVTYWEGAVSVRGTHKGRPVTGDGYAELTGYAKHFQPKI
jgi:predicted secreted hydrolase